MAGDDIRDDIAFIRRTVEEGRAYARLKSPDFMVWGAAVAVGYLGTYAHVRGWWGLDPNWLWLACIGAGWLFSLRGALGSLTGRTKECRRVSPMSQALRMLWLGCGICLSTLAILAVATHEMQRGWFDAVVAAILGIGFFAGSSLCNVAWMRWVAVGWWLGEAALFAVHGRAEVLAVGAALMLGLLFLPGLILWRGGTGAASHG